MQLAFVKPYILSILTPTPSSLLASQNNQQQTWPRIHVRSSLSLSTIQTLSYPSSLLDGTLVPASGVSMRSLVSSPASSPPAFFISTPNEKAVAVAEGRTIWTLGMESWGQQINEIVYR